MVIDDGGFVDSIEQFGLGSRVFFDGGYDGGGRIQCVGLSGCVFFFMCLGGEFLFLRF